VASASWIFFFIPFLRYRSRSHDEGELVVSSSLTSSYSSLFLTLLNLIYLLFPQELCHYETKWEVSYDDRIA